MGLADGMLRISSIRLRKMRESRGLTKTQFAKKMGLELSQYGRIESGKEPIPLKRLNSIIQNDEVSADLLWAIFEDQMDSLMWKINDNLKGKTVFIKDGKELIISERGKK